MRHDPIEFAMLGRADRNPLAPREEISSRGAKRLHCSSRGVGLTSDPYAVDEAFACFDGISTSQCDASDRRMVNQALVSDLAGQLEALDRQRERLAGLLRSIETNSIAD